MGAGGGEDDGQFPGMTKRGWLADKVEGRGGVMIKVLVNGAGERGGEEDEGSDEETMI